MADTATGVKKMSEKMLARRDAANSRWRRSRRRCWAEKAEMGRAENADMLKTESWNEARRVSGWKRNSRKVARRARPTQAGKPMSWWIWKNFLPRDTTWNRTVARMEGRLFLSMPPPLKAGKRQARMAGKALVTDPKACDNRL